MVKINRAHVYDREVLDKLHAVHLEMIQDLEKVCEKYGLKYFATFGTALGAERHQGFIPWDDDTDVGMLREDYEVFLNVVEKEIGDKYQILTPNVDKRYACNVTKLQKKGTIFISHLSKRLKCEQCIFVDIFPFDVVAPTKRKAKRQQVMATFWSRLLYLCGTPYPVIPYTGMKYYIASVICWCVHYFAKIVHLSPRFLYNRFVKICTKYNHSGGGIVTSFGDAEALQYMFPAKNMFPTKQVPFEGIKINVLNNNKEHLKNAFGDYMKIPPKDQRINHAPYKIQFDAEDKNVNRV